MLEDNHGTPRLQPSAESHAVPGGAADPQESSRARKGRAADFYTALKLSGATAGLPPLRPTTTSALMASRSGQRPVTAGDTPRVDGEILDPALTALAFRAGSLQGLPELQVIVKDAVTDTIQSIHPIVVNMVTKLLTKETIRVTKRTALALSQEQLGELQASQEKISGALERARDSWNQQLVEVRAEKDALEATCRQLSEGYQRLVDRDQTLENTLQRVALLEAEMSEKEAQVQELRAKMESNSSDLQHVHKNALEFEQRCRTYLVTHQILEKVAEEVTQSAKNRESAMQGTIENVLKSYVLATDLANKFKEFEASIGNALQKDRGNIEEKLHFLRTTLNDTRSELFAQYVTKDDLVVEREEEDKKRGRLHADFAGQVSDLQSKDDQQEQVIGDLLRLRPEHEQMSETFRQTRSEVNEQSAQMHEKFESFTESISTHWQEFKDVKEELKEHKNVVDTLQSAVSNMKEQMNNDRLRATATFSQQQHNRKCPVLFVQRLSAQENTHLTMPPSAQQPVTTSSSDQTSGAGPLGEILFATFEAPSSTPNTQQSYATTLLATPLVPYRGTENRGEWDMPMQVPWQNQLPDPPPLGNPATDRELEEFLEARTAIRSDVQVQKAGFAENTSDITILQDQVSQWKDAIAAQQELRKETSNLHGEVEAIHREIAKLADDQQLAIANLRSVHTAWLSGSVNG